MSAFAFAFGYVLAFAFTYVLAFAFTYEEIIIQSLNNNPVSLATFL